MTGRITAEEREKRFEEILVDAYTREEQAMGWAIYLEETMAVPFDARCIEVRDESPLREGETVRVTGVSQAAPSLRRQFVLVDWNNRELGVPLAQLAPVEASEATARAIADWHAWLDR